MSNFSYIYTVKGSVRGIIYKGYSETKAIKAIVEDRKSCKKVGGYSDVELYCNNNLVDTLDKEIFPEL